MDPKRNPHKGGQDVFRTYYSTTSTTVPHGETLSAKSLPEISSGCLLYRWPGEKQPPIYGDAGPILSADGEDCTWGITKQSDDPAMLEGCSLATAIGTLGEVLGWHGVAWPVGQQRPLLFLVIDPIKGLLEPYGLSVAECINKVKEIAQAKPNGPAPPSTAGSGKNKRHIKPKIHNGDELTTLEFPPLRWAIEGILPAGATLFAGLPKKGKSRLTLNVGYAVSSGGYALGKIKVDQGEALYIALDDQKRRILEILKAMSPNGQIPTGLHVAFDWPRLGAGCEDELNDWLYHHREHARFVCLDVIKHVRQIGTNKNPYRRAR